MAPGIRAYTLVGFSPELDWRPLCFVKPVPLHKVCEACGLIRKNTSLLPCRHILCESCYELSARDSGHVCPLDGHQFEEDDVDLKEFPAEELLRREVKCWNEGSECKAVLPASQIAQHFERECRHHCVRCPRCSAKVLCTDVCAHLESECSTTAKPAGSEVLGDAGQKAETALLTSFREILEEQAIEIKTLLGRLLLGANSGDRLSEVVHGVNKCQEVLREELRQGIANVKDTLSQEVAQVRTEYRECLKTSSAEIAAFSEESKERFIASSHSIKSISNSVDGLKSLLRDELEEAAKEKRENVSQVAGGSERYKGKLRERNDAIYCMHKEVLKPPDIQPSAFLTAESAKVAREKGDNVSQAKLDSEGAKEQIEESSNAMGGMDRAMLKLPDIQASVFLRGELAKLARRKRDNVSHCQ